MAVAEGRLEGMKIQVREGVKNRDFNERLRDGFDEAVRNWGDKLVQGELVKLIEDLKTGKEIGAGEGEQAAERMYKAGQIWVRQDYKGFLKWLGAAGVPTDLNEAYVRALNASGDKRLLAASIEEMVDLLKKGGRLGEVLPGEEQLLMMADKMRGLLLDATGGKAGGSEKSGGIGGGGDANFPDNFDFNPDEEPGEVRVLPEPPQGGQALYDLGKGEPDIPVSERKELYVEIKRKIGTLVGLGCLTGCLLASMALCGGQQFLSSIGGGTVGAAAPTLLPYEVGSGEENRQAAETLTDKIFGGGDSQHRFIDRFLDNYQGAAERGDAEFQLAYEIAMRGKLKSEGILGETGQQFDRWRLEDELNKQGYDQGDIDALADWVELNLVR